MPSKDAPAHRHSRPGHDRRFGTESLEFGTFGSQTAILAGLAVVWRAASAENEAENEAQDGARMSTAFPARPLGGTAVRVSTLGFGGAPIGNFQRTVDDATAAATVDAAWDAGVRFFDTAPHYGLGLSERRLGRALAGRPRAGYTICTKVGRVLVPDPARASARDDRGFEVPATHRRVWDFSADGVRRSLEGSLERLGTDRADVVLLHDPDEHWRAAVEEALPALAELRAQGVAGAIGAGMNQWKMLAGFVREADVDVVLVAGRYTLLDQSALDVLLPLCAERGVSVLAAGVFNTGVLATAQPRPDATFNYIAAPPEIVDRVRRIAAVCARHAVTLPQAALAFPFGHPAVAGVVVGMGSASEVAENAALAGRAVPADLWRELVAEGLLRADAPAPPHLALRDQGG
jgi:D-threo-aldose 1-dehydrogenase